jgi:DICT domain-containing protein
MWETRYGFPEPTRLPSGHRRYCERDVELVAKVLDERAAGRSLPAAIERVRRSAEEPELSIYAGLRRRRPELTPYLMPKRTLVGMSHAIEDECAARAQQPLLFGSFQREPYYRRAERRWRELSRTAEIAVAFADFPARRDPQDGPLEIPIDRSCPLGREWALICDCADLSAALAAWERPGQDDVPDLERLFETIWTIEPEMVREAARISAGLTRREAPELRARLDKRLDEPPEPNHDGLRLVASLASRMVAYVSRSGGAGRAQVGTG